MNNKPFYDYFDDFDYTRDPDSEQSEELDAYYETTTVSEPQNVDADTEAADFDYEPESDADAEASDDFTDPAIIIPSVDDETAACEDCNCGCDRDTTRAQQKCALDDYEIISDVLGGEKQLVKLYSTALCESAEEPLRYVIRENLIECAADQYSAFEYMQERGMYPTEDATEDKILQAKQQFTSLVD